MNFSVSDVSASSDSLDFSFLENLNGDDAISGSLSPFPTKTFEDFDTGLDSISDTVVIEDYLSINEESNTDQSPSLLDSLLAVVDPLINANISEKDVSSLGTPTSSPDYFLAVKDFFENDISEDFLSQFSSDFIESPTTVSDEQNALSFSPMINNFLEEKILNQLDVPDLVGDSSSPENNSNDVHEALFGCSCEEHKASDSHHQVENIDISIQKKGIYIPENVMTPSVPAPMLKDYRILNNVSLDQVLDSSRGIPDDRGMYESADPADTLTPYSPRVYRYLKCYDEFRKSTGRVVERQGLCPYCPMEVIHNEHTSFFDLNPSEYSLHLSLCHGVFTTGDFIRQPIVHKMGLEFKAIGEPRSVECIECPYDNCKKVFKVNSKQPGAKKLGAYIRHARKCHMIREKKKRF
ncbi:unnamed protein product [Ambrosiozyma monospora]|uniref:Unnamed protein product n=1 Tax=Ambrosiozyma monospora TaxID=43982 RepID=A0ACB5T9Z7_AMBMO|nr:unnamed protein product [Ambrosiozyma monospora]